jgi:hypothetical protein
MNRRTLTVLIAMLISTSCGGGEQAEPSGGSTAPVTAQTGATVASGRTDATVVPDTATSATPPATTPVATPAATGAPAEDGAPASDLPDPCALVTVDEIAEFIEPGAVGTELDPSIGYDPALLRECDWPGSERGLSIQLQNMPDLLTSSGTGDPVVPIEGAGMEAAAIVGDDGDSLVMIDFDTGDVQLILIPWERISVGSPEADALVALGGLVAERL